MLEPPIRLCSDVNATVLSRQISLTICFAPHIQHMLGGSPNGGISSEPIAKLNPFMERFFRELIYPLFCTHDETIGSGNHYFLQAKLLHQRSYVDWVNEVCFSKSP